MAEKKVNPQQEQEARIQLFDKEYQALQRKYGIRLAAQYLTPVNPSDLTGPMLITTVPIQAFPINIMPEAVIKEEVTKPE